MHFKILFWDEATYFTVLPKENMAQKGSELLHLAPDPNSPASIPQNSLCPLLSFPAPLFCWVSLSPLKKKLPRQNARIWLGEMPVREEGSLELGELWRRERRNKGWEEHPKTPVKGKFSKAIGKSWSKVSCQRSPLSPRNGSALGSLLSSVTGWEQPSGKLALDFREKQLGPLVNFTPHSVRSVRSILTATTVAHPKKRTWCRGPVQGGRWAW